MKKNILLLLFITTFSSWSNTSSIDNSALKNTIWHDLITPNLDKSQTFYKELFGWSYNTFNVKGFKYALIENKGQTIGSIIEVADTKSSVWVSSLIVSPQEMRERVKDITASGAVLVVKPLKIPGRGKQLIFKGLQGETFSLITNTDNVKPFEVKDQEGSWFGMELWVSDIDKAKVFYKKAFQADTKEVTYDNKPYYFFTVNGTNVGGLMKNPLTNMESQWVPYLNIQNLNDIVEKVTNLKGELVLSPNKNIRNGSIGIIQDSFGAILCIQKK